jgi:hypothetical protein
MPGDKKSGIEVVFIPEEPYVLLEDGTGLAGWGRDEEIIYNQQYRQKEKLVFYRSAFDFLSSHSIKGAYFEFGCHKARTFRMVLTEARKKNMNEMRFYAFDSFQGLPDHGDNISQNPQWAPSALVTSEEGFMALIRKHNIYVDKVKTVRGYYEASLTKALAEDFTSRGIKAALVTVDCDLYDSYVSVFNFLDGILQEGTVLYLDDYRSLYKGSPLSGVPKALNEYKSRSAFGFDPFLDIGWFGKSFIAYKK